MWVSIVRWSIRHTGYSDLVLAAHKPETNVQPVSYGKKVEHVAESEGGEACLRALEDVALQLVTEANRRAEEVRVRQPAHAFAFMGNGGQTLVRITAP